MTQKSNIKRLKDGSIDHAYYIANGTEIRSNETLQALTGIRVAIGKYLKTTWVKLSSYSKPKRSALPDRVPTI